MPTMRAVGASFVPRAPPLANNPRLQAGLRCAARLRYAGRAASVRRLTAVKPESEELTQRHRDTEAFLVPRLRLGTHLPEAPASNPSSSHENPLLPHGCVSPIARMWVVTSRRRD